MTESSKMNVCARSRLKNHFKVYINGPSVWPFARASPPQNQLLSLVFSNHSMLLLFCDMFTSKLWFIEANRKHDRSNESGVCWNFIRLEHFFFSRYISYTISPFTANLISLLENTRRSMSFFLFVALECCYLNEG